ncbi:MAG: HEAT repeat domain-containing protein [Candidatus Brocadiia bacterium]
MNLKKNLTFLMVFALAINVASPGEADKSAALEEAIQKFQKEYNETSHPYARAEILLKMGQFDEPGFVDFIVDLLKQVPDNRSNFIIRHTAAEKIGELKNEKAVDRAIEQIAKLRGRGTAAVRAALVRGLGLNTSEKALEGLLKGLKAREEEVRTVAARYAARLKNPAAIPLLAGTTTRIYKEARLEAYNALVELTGCKLPVDSRRWNKWWEKHKDKIEQLPAPEECKVEEEIKDWPMVEDFNFQCRTPRARSMALRRKAYPKYRRGIVNAISGGLKWLAEHQAKEGFWDVDNFWADDPRYKNVTLEKIKEKRKKEKEGVVEWDEEIPRPGIGSIGPGMDLPATGLTLMAFCGHGYTHRHGKYKETVQKALDWMIKKQNDNGGFSNNMYIHAICSHALIEFWGVTRDLDLKEPAQKAVDFLCWAQTENMGWRYHPNSKVSDSSVSSWCSMALQTARRSGLEVPAENLVWCRKFWDKITVYSGQEGGKEYGEAFYKLDPSGSNSGSGTYANTAASILCRIFMGTRNRARSVQAGAAYLKDVSISEYKPNIYMWIYATQGLFQMGGPQWRGWERQVMPTIAKMQVHPRGTQRTGDEGSFYVESKWISGRLGRIGTTAACCIILETYYFYPEIKNE